jgi:flagellar basal body-associated protein FliL
MADEEKKTSSKRKVLKIVIIVLLSAVLLGGGIFAGYYISSKDKTNTQVYVKPVGTGITQKTFSLDEFLVNLKSDNASRYLKVKIYVGYADVKANDDLEEELENNKAILRDAVNTVLRSKKPEDFSDAGVEKIKEEIKKKINPTLTKGQILDVYFYEIIVQ